jgi:glucuronoxylan 4-O-methyltransferase
MDLPVELGSRRWDVILVDGPAGYDDTQPGRMKSIYAASRLVAAGGRVFVHDCDRPAERAFTSRYLGDDRLFVEAKGRATLRGYTF